jgi:integrase/recombinase XerD
VVSFPQMVRTTSGLGEARYALGDWLVDRYLEFVAGRARPNTLRAVAFDLKTFFTVISKEPAAVTPADVFEFLAHQRGDRSVIRLADRESGLSARTIARRLSSVSGLYAYLLARGDTPVQANPVPRGLLTRRQGGSRRSRTVPLVRVPRTLPRILPPQDADRLVAALRTHRDRAMVLAMLLAGLRRCEVLGLRFQDVQVADRRLAAAILRWRSASSGLREPADRLRIKTAKSGANAQHLTGRPRRTGSTQSVCKPNVLQIDPSASYSRPYEP